MPLATLSIDLEAKLARLEQGLNRAVQLSEQQAGRMQAVFSAAQGAAASLGVAATGALAAAAVFTRGQAAIATLDYLDDLAEKYGVAASSLSEYRFAAEVAGTPIDALAAGLGKLSKASAEGNAALKALGVQTKDSQGNLRAIDQVLLDVADRFKSAEDGPLKAAYAVAIFGKSGADLIPILNKGAAGISELRDQAKRLGVSFTDEAAKQAGDFNDNLKRLELASQSLAVQIASKLLPTLLDLSNEYLRAYERGDRLATLWERIKGNAGFDQLSKDQKAAAEASGAVANAVAMIEDFQQAVKANPGNESLGKQLEYWRKRYTDLAAAAAAANDKLKATAQAINPVVSDRFKDTRQVPLERAPLPSLDQEALAATKRRDEAFQKFLQKLQQQRAVVQAELDLGDKLADSDKERIKLLGELGDKTIGYTAAQKAAGGVEVERLVRLQRTLEAQQKQATITATLSELDAKALSARQAENEALARQTEQLQQQLKEYGLTTQQLDALRLARLDEAVATAAQTAERLRASAATDAEISAAERTLSLLVQQRAAVQGLQAAQADEQRNGLAGLSKGFDDYLQSIQQVGITTRQVSGQAAASLEDDLVNSLKNGRLNVSRTIDYIISEFLRLQVVQPLLKSLFSSFGGTTLFGGLAKLFGFADGGAFSASAPIPFAAGGIFDSPHLFRFANGASMSAGVLGEAGPEAIMPLMRGPGGKLGVRNYGGGAQSVVIYQTNHYGGGVSRNEMAAWSQRNKADTLASVADAQRRGVRALQGA